MKTMRMIVAELTAMLLATVAQAATYYVDVNYDGFNGVPNGSVSRPFTNLYAAAVAYTNGSGHTVRVAAGEYKSTVEGGYELFGQSGFEAGYNLQGIAGNWHGGYVGQVNEDTFDWTEASRVVPDADAIAPASVTVINLTNANARAFYSSAYQHILNFTGFVFRDSDVSQANYDGGALYVAGGMHAAAVHRCVFINNKTTGHGGALWHSGRGGTSTYCVFIGNSAGKNGGGAYMGPGNSGQTIRHFTFENNTAGGIGGGLGIRAYTVNVDQSHFENNTAGGNGGGLGGASSTITRSRFIGNAANGIGGAVGQDVWDGISLTVVNCLIVGNTASAWAVAVNAGHNNATLTVRHTTFADNTGGGVRANVNNVSANATLTVLNSIIVNNGAKGLEYTDSGTLNVDYNNVIGHTADYVGMWVCGYVSFVTHTLTHSHTNTPRISCF